MRIDHSHAGLFRLTVIVVSIDMVSGAVRLKRSTILILSLGGTPPVIRVNGENPIVSTTSVSFSQRPIDVPWNSGLGSEGIGLPPG